MRACARTQVRPQSGFTLPELLLSLTLGTTILLATTLLFIELRAGFVYQSQWRELHERGRHLMQFFTTQLHQAGYPKVGFIGNALMGSDGVPPAAHDTLVLSYQGIKDCAGSSSTTVEYYLSDDNLRCDGNGGASPSPQTLSNPVDGLQLRYGVDSDDSGSIDRYYNAAEVTDWEQVHSVTVAVLLRSEIEARESRDETTYSLLGTQYGPFDDRYLRKLYQNTVQLRNH